MKKFALALLLALCLPAASLALPLTSADIAKMVQDCPTLEEYKGVEPAVIWSRKQLYTQDSQGRAVKSTSYVILCGATARLGWIQDQLVAPNGGHIELEQAAIFDPGTAELLHNLPYDRDELAEHGRLIVNFPKMDDVYVLVLSYRQTFAEPNVMEDIAWLGSEYPTWEGSVQIRVAKDQALDWESSTDAIPTIDVDETFRRYGWFYFKQPANRGMRGMLESSDPYVVFSLTTGPATAVAMMHTLEERRWPDLPAKYVVGESSSRDNVLKTIEKFWRSADRLPGRGTWRSARMIPAGGPWTTWESMYLLASWLQKQGWKAEVWFQHVLPQDRESISCAPALTHPVFLLSEPGAQKPFTPPARKNCAAIRSAAPVWRKTAFPSPGILTSTPTASSPARSISACATTGSRRASRWRTDARIRSIRCSPGSKVGSTSIRISISRRWAARVSNWFCPSRRGPVSKDSRG